MLTVETIDEIVGDGSYQGEGTVTNTGTTPATDTMVRGIVRDADGRIAGTTPSPFTSTIEVGETRPFTLWAAGAIRNKANPMLLISGTDYSVEFIAGTRGPVASPGCTFGRPWD